MQAYEIEFPYRVYFRQENLELIGRQSYDKTTVERLAVCPAHEANLVSSLMAGGAHHAPVIDIDYEAALLPSTTPGHYHLYLNKPVKWRKYKRVLKAMYKAGLIEKGYYGVAKARKMTMLRLPSVPKQSGQVI